MSPGNRLEIRPAGLSDTLLSSLDVVLSQWAYFIVHRFISVYLCVFFVFFCFILHSCIIMSTVGWT